MKKTLLAATSLLALVAFGAQASDEHKAANTAKDAVKTEATTEAGKVAEGAATEATTTEAAPAAGEVKKDDHKKDGHK